MIHRLRQQCISHRTSLSNQVHAYLLEFGISLPKGVKAIHKNLSLIFEKNELGPIVIEWLHELLAAISQEEEREDDFNKLIADWVKQDERVQIGNIKQITKKSDCAYISGKQPDMRGGLKRSDLM